MKIKAKYYYADKGMYRSANDFMILQDRQIINPNNQPGGTKNSRPFYYDDTNYSIVYGPEEKKEKVVINRLITEAEYTIQQQEYLTRLTWFQKQKLTWMFKRHWLQRPGIMMHLFIAGLMLTIAMLGFGLIKGHY